LEHSAEGEIATLVCQECGEELRVRDGIELALVAEAWAEGIRELGHEVYGEPPEDVHCINDHPCGWQELRHSTQASRHSLWRS
jgi:hypothetical protein